MPTESRGPLPEASGNAGNPSMKETFGLNSYRFTRGKWILLAVATLMVAAGVLLGKRSTGGTGGTLAGGKPNSLLGSSFAGSRLAADGTAMATTPADGADARAVSVFLVKGGFGAFIGFAIGFAIRSFVRLAVVMLGVYFLALMFMSHAGWVEIHWSLMQDQFNRSVATLGEQFTSFKAFLTGAIPSSSMGALGLAWGLRRR